MYLQNLPQYDMLAGEDLSRKEGTLMLSGNQGIREKSGNEIWFSSQKEYTEDLLKNKQGDRYSETGTLNMKDNTLTFEAKMERGGKVIERTVFESVILPDGTYLQQFFHVTPSEEKEGALSTTAVFKRMNQKEYSAVTAHFDEKVDFAYDTIIGKGDVSTDTMSSKYEATGKFTVRDGTAAFSK
jgi:hypothetical protein